MKKLGGCLLVVLAILSLNGCAQSGYTSATGSNAGSSSGITVYGDIDTSIVRTR